MTDASPLALRIAFSSFPGVNLGTGTKLLQRVGSEEEFFACDDSALAHLLHGKSGSFGREKRDAELAKATKEEEFVRRNNILPLYFTGEPEYPGRLAQCDDAPAMLYKLGRCDLNAPHFVAIVGTRNADIYGNDITRRIVEGLAERLDSLTVVSGLAYGIDAAAHQAALDCDVPTVGVLANPLNTIYPAEHRNLASRIIERGGALVTEYPTSIPIHRGNFLARNRIIAGMCDATIVVQSKAKGGAMVTAHIANAYDREVFAVPGRMTDTLSRGCNSLIANNTAHILDSIDGFIDLMGWRIAQKKEGQQQSLPLELPEDQELVLRAIIEHPEFTVNDLTAHLGRSYSQLTDSLFELEMSGLIASIPGQRYVALNTEKL